MPPPSFHAVPQFGASRQPESSSSFDLGARGFSSAQTGTIAVPVPAIVGGTSAGVIIAVVVVLGWKWWGRSAKQIQNKQSNRSRTLRKRRNRTLRSMARESPPRSPDSSMTRTFVEEKGNPKHPSSAPMSNKSASSSVISFHTAEETKHDRPPTPPTMPPELPEKATRRPASLARSNSNPGARSSIVRSGKELSYKSSTIGSASVYSTQSGEEHQIRVPTNVVLAALGHTFDTKRFSTLSQKSESLHSLGESQGPSAFPRSRMRHVVQSDRGTSQLNRVSQISAGSLHLQPEDTSGTLIGFAYGGEL